ncbi:MAG: hypothetical protein GY820_44585 [Gammaproteobacteria bacterium]|nr:hypothetical protein [Gammaproteobacteria bacterium]
MEAVAGVGPVPVDKFGEKRMADREKLKEFFRTATGGTLHDIKVRGSDSTVVACSF